MSKRAVADFPVGMCVWAKMRSYPWWPGQISDPNGDLSKAVLKVKKKNCCLVFFPDSTTFAWTAPKDIREWNCPQADEFKTKVDSAIFEEVDKIYEEMGGVDASFPVVEDDNAPSIDEEPVEKVPKKKRIVRKKEKKEVTNSKKPSKRKRMIEDDIEVEEESATKPKKKAKKKHTQPKSKPRDLNGRKMDQKHGLGVIVKIPSARKQFQILKVNLDKAVEEDDELMIIGVLETLRRLNTNFHLLQEMKIGKSVKRLKKSSNSTIAFLAAWLVDEYAEVINKFLAAESAKKVEIEKMTTTAARDADSNENVSLNTNSSGDAHKTENENVQEPNEVAATESLEQQEKERDDDAINSLPTDGSAQNQEKNRDKGSEVSEMQAEADKERMAKEKPDGREQESEGNSKSAESETERSRETVSQGENPTAMDTD